VVPGDIHTINLAQFELAFRQAVSEAIGVNLNQVVIQNIASGSIVVNFTIVGSYNEDKLSAVLQSETLMVPAPRATSFMLVSLLVCIVVAVAILLVLCGKAIY
jgi:hypothetical protein